MLEEGVKEYYTAKRLAADRLGATRLPSNRQIRSVIVALTSIDAEARRRWLRRLREVAVVVMERLSAFEPRLIGSVASGAVHSTSDIDLHVFCVDHRELERELDAAGFDAVREERPVLKDGRLHRFVHYRFDVDGIVPVELSVYEPSELGRVRLSSIDGRPIDRVPLGRVRELLRGDGSGPQRRCLEPGEHADRPGLQQDERDARGVGVDEARAEKADARDGPGRVPDHDDAHREGTGPPRGVGHEGADGQQGEPGVQQQSDRQAQ